MRGEGKKASVAVGQVNCGRMERQHERDVFCQILADLLFRQDEASENKCTQNCHDDLWDNFCQK